MFGLTRTTVVRHRPNFCRFRAPISATVAVAISSASGQLRPTSPQIQPTPGNLPQLGQHRLESAQIRRSRTRFSRSRSEAAKHGPHLARGLASSERLRQLSRCTLNFVGRWSVWQRITTEFGQSLAEHGPDSTKVGATLPRRGRMQRAVLKTQHLLAPESVTPQGSSDLLERPRTPSTDPTLCHDRTLSRKGSSCRPSRSEFYDPRGCSGRRTGSSRGLAKEGSSRACFGTSSF